MLRTIYVWISFCAAGALLAAKLNVVWHDPWCTPRLTPYNLLFELVCRRVVPLLLPLFLGGVVGLAASTWARRRWEVWLAGNRSRAGEQRGCGLVTEVGFHGRCQVGKDRAAL
jgi:hypothetical protein